MVTGADDIQRTYEGPQVGSGLFTDLPGVAEVLGPDHQSLDVMYYDTDDLRLTRAGITLRRAGDDAGWHAELPVGGGRSRVLRVPPARSADDVPSELAHLVTAYTADRPLQQCAHIRTERDVWRLVGDNGDTLAEVADDSVRSQALGDGAESNGNGQVNTWHAVRVSSPTGGQHTLDAVGGRLSTAGVTPSRDADELSRTLGRRLPVNGRPGLDEDSSGGAVVVAYLRAQVEQLRTADVAVRLDAPDGIHDLRVAVRRLRSCLRVFGRIIDRDSTRPLNTELKWLSDVLGDARDNEVLRAELTRSIDATPTELVLGPVRATVQRYLAKRTTAADTALRAALAGGRYLALLGALDAVLADPPYRDLAHQRAVRVLPPLVGRAYRKARRAAEAVDAADRGLRRNDALHEVRKSVKRLRYAAETVQPVAGEPADRYRRRARKVQGVLGEHHDLVVSRPVLRELGVQAHLGSANGFTFGLLHGRAGELALVKEQEYPLLWQRLATPKARQWMRG